MKMRQLMMLGISTVVTTGVFAESIELCVFDVMGANGITMTLAKDYALFAQKQGVEIQPKVYKKVDEALADFDNKKCAGLVADNFVTRKYNVFMGTVGAVGAINDYRIAQKVLMALGSPKLAHKLSNQQYEVVGYMPYGLAYFFVKDRSIDSLDKIMGKTVGVLADDPSQRRMAQKVGLKPVIMTFDNAPTKFRNGDFEVVPAPLIIWEPFEGEKLIGPSGGVTDYPLAFMTMNFILTKGNYPADFAQKSRAWFSRQSPQLIHTVKRWDSKVPARTWIEVQDIDRTGYDRLLSQLRKEFIQNRVYDPTMMTLIRRLRCNQEPSFIECTK